MTERSVGDCAVRAVSKVLNTTWEDAYALLCTNGFVMGDMPNSNIVIASVLREHGFKRFNIPNNCPDCFTVEEFSDKFNKGTYLAGTGDHVVAIVNGNYYDSWSSGDRVIAYAWYKE